MNWTLAIEINRHALLRMLAELFAMIGAGETVTRQVRAVMLATLRPAEASARRLIAIAASRIVVASRTPRCNPVGTIPKASGQRAPVFRLIDPRRHAGPPKPNKVPGFGPNARWLDGIDTAGPAQWAAPLPGDPVSAARLSWRLNALRNALGDIPAQAKRLARKLATQERPLPAMRPGRPPGYNARGRRPIDLLLADCHQLALMALAEVPP